MKKVELCACAGCKSKSNGHSDAQAKAIFLAAFFCFGWFIPDLWH
jgi:hypothetical protein